MMSTDEIRMTMLVKVRNLGKKMRYLQDYVLGWSDTEVAVVIVAVVYLVSGVVGWVG